MNYSFLIILCVFIGGYAEESNNSDTTLSLQLIRSRREKFSVMKQMANDFSGGVSCAEVVADMEGARRKRGIWSGIKNVFKSVGKLVKTNVIDCVQYGWKQITDLPKIVQKRETNDVKEPLVLDTATEKMYQQFITALEKVTNYIKISALHWNAIEVPISVGTTKVKIFSKAVQDQYQFLKRFKSSIDPTSVRNTFRQILELGLDTERFLEIMNSHVNNVKRQVRSVAIFNSSNNMVKRSEEQEDDGETNEIEKEITTDDNKISLNHFIENVEIAKSWIALNEHATKLSPRISKKSLSNHKTMFFSNSLTSTLEDLTRSMTCKLVYQDIVSKSVIVKRDVSEKTTQLFKNMKFLSDVKTCVKHIVKHVPELLTNSTEIDKKEHAKIIGEKLSKIFISTLHKVKLYLINLQTHVNNVENDMNEKILVKSIKEIREVIDYYCTDSGIKYVMKNVYSDLVQSLDKIGDFVMDLAWHKDDVKKIATDKLKSNSISRRRREALPFEAGVDLKETNIQETLNRAHLARSYVTLWEHLTTQNPHLSNMEENDIDTITD